MHLRSRSRHFQRDGQPGIQRVYANYSQLNYYPMELVFQFDVEYNTRYLTEMCFCGFRDDLFFTPSNCCLRRSWGRWKITKCLTSSKTESTTSALQSKVIFQLSFFDDYEFFIVLERFLMLAIFHLQRVSCLRFACPNGGPTLATLTSITPSASWASCRNRKRSCCTEQRALHELISPVDPKLRY